jgi:polar amino acid transport system substrate-binding protein
MRTFRYFLAAAAICLVAIPALAVSPKELQDRGFVRMGFSNEIPFSYAAANGTLGGIDYEVMKHVLGELGINSIDGVLTPFGSLIPGLKAGRFDVVATGLYIRPDRCQQVAFSEPTMVVSSAVIVPAGNPKKIHSFQDVAADPQFRLGYVVGGTQTIAKAGNVRDDQFVSFTDVLTAVSALKAGRVEGVLRTYIDAVQVVNDAGQGAIEVAQPFAAPVKDGKPLINYIGFAFRTEDKELLAAFNRALTKFLGSPEHLALLKKYQIIQPAYPIDKSTADLCRG